ncbi:MAG TPA: rhodanese-like domain-containing protein [Rhizomicrobium sp.]|jgi:rhodanese-related sulfurtransferase|nr:rhodanese-like domain-containing protein [Rhizomicrobium sp.]
MRARRQVLSFVCAAPFLKPFAAHAVGSDAVPGAALMKPAELADLLKGGGPQPMILQVGFERLYAQAHIPGALYAGPGNQDDGLAKLKSQVGSFPHDRAIVIYCGCCPWTHCPNIGAAYTALHDAGFTNLKVLYIADNFGADWVDKGYPVTRGG